jgi:hypothetical protein
MRVEVEDQDWDADVGNIHSLLQDVAGQLTRHFLPAPTGRVRVRRRRSGESPFTPFRSSPKDDYVIELTAHGQFWCSYVYEFAHELCHVLSDYERLRSTPNEWFQETLCDLASIFALRQMAVVWREAAPYPNWCDFAPAMSEYADDHIACNFLVLPADITFADWFQVSECRLRVNSHQMHLNGVVLVRLLPIFQSTPQHWPAVRYMPNTDEKLEVFLAQWKDACPGRHKPFVSTIAQLFARVPRLVYRAAFK